VRGGNVGVLVVGTDDVTCTSGTRLTVVRGVIGTYDREVHS
jgi:hypothetical protein